MEVSLKKFNSFVDEFSKVKKFITEGKVVIKEDWTKRDYNNHNYDQCYSIHYDDLKFKNISNAHQFTKHSRIENAPKIMSIDGVSDKNNPAAKIKAILASNDSAESGIQKLSLVNSQRLAQEYNTLRFIPKTELAEKIGFPFLITQAPIEVMEGDHTYRVICSAVNHQIYLIGRDDDDVYDYLDRGFLIYSIKEINKEGKINRHIVVSNQLDVHTMHIFVLCQLQPKLTEFLEKGCFVHSANAQIVRLKMEKKLDKKHRTKYEQSREAIEKDYQGNTSLVLINNLNNKEISKVALNDITLQTTSASYDRITIEADDLLPTLYSKLNFGGEFDIYSIIETYAHYVQEKLDEEGRPPAGQIKNIPTIKVNGFNIDITLSHSGVRHINGMRINKAEIWEAIYRASCHHSQNEYDLFLKRISKMSLLWHDIIANGLPIKIHDNMTWDEFKLAKPGAAAPALKFFIDKVDRCIKLKTEKPQGCRVRLGKLIEKIDTINRRTNNRWTRNGMESRNHRWARKELAKALKDVTTYTKKVKREDGTEVDEVTVGITALDITKLIQIADDYKKAAIQKSKDFLATAVKFTNAEEIEFLGKKAYKVDGDLRSYAIVVDTAKVYDYQTKQYRCIVNDNHFRGVGYDDIAARLYALKNDSMMQKKIGTLAGNAQPGAENAHNDYVPDRDIEEQVLEILALD
jgi:hypothetical protein